MTLTAGGVPSAAPPPALDRLPEPERPAAASPAGATVATRLLAAVVWMVVLKLAGRPLVEMPVLSLLAHTSVACVTAAVLFGWMGVLAAAVVQLGWVWMLQGLDGVYPWASTASYAAGAALCWATFRYVPRLGRGFPNLRTVLFYALAAVASALLSSIVISATGHTEDVWQEVAVWSRSTVVSLWVFAPALLVLGDRRLRRLLAPIPGEVLVQPPQRLALVREATAGTGRQVVDVAARQERFGRVTAVAVLCVLAISALRFAPPWAHGMAWFSALYLVVIWWMAQRLRLPGALVAVALVSLAVLGGYAVLGVRGEVIPDQVALSLYGQQLSFWLVGILLARDADREARLLDGMAELHERLEQDLQRVVLALTGAVEAKDAYTGGHLQRVNAFAREVGRRLGLRGRELELLHIASTLHDIGKIGIPESILNKRGPLDAAEWEAMQRHPEIGASLLRRIEGLREAAPLVLHHQERWDGRREGRFPGYPHGLAGEAIPLGARIIAVVDSFDAMTTDRPYRGALSAAAARDVLLGERGAQFDPRVVDAFLRLLDELPWESEPPQAEPLAPAP